MKALNMPILLIILAIASFFLLCEGSSVLSARTAEELVVQQGDTLWSIAVKLDPAEDPRCTIDQIMALNKMTSPEIKPGQLIYVP